MSEDLNGELTTYVVPEPERPRRGRLVAGGAVLAAALVAGGFAIISFGASDGSGTPEAAVEKLFDAVEDADAVGVLESLAPGERASLRPGIENLAGELARLGVLEEGFELGPISGLDVQIDGLRLSSEALADGVSAVTVEAGTITASTDTAALPLGPVVGTLVEGASVPTDSVTEDLAGAGGVIVAVEEAGSWHVSLWYTVAESARRSAGEAVPDFGHGVVPTGAESPEAAVSAALAAGLRLDAAGVIALLDPDETRALHDYAPLFLDDVATAAEEAMAEGGYALQVDRLDTTVEQDGATARVTVTGFAVSGRLPDIGAVSASFDGTCVTWETEADGEQEKCLDELAEEGLAAADTSTVVTAVERDGKWYLSPTRTVLDGLLVSLRQMDPGALLGEGGLQLFGRGMLGGIMGLGGSAEGWSEYSGEGAPTGPHETTVVPSGETEASTEEPAETPTTAGGGY